MVETGSEWDDPIAVQITGKVPALVASTSKVNLCSEVMNEGRKHCVGEAGRLQNILGKQETQRITERTEAKTINPQVGFQLG